MPRYLVVFLAFYLQAQTQPDLNFNPSLVDYAGHPASLVDEYDCTGDCNPATAPILVWAPGGGFKTAFKTCNGPTYYVCSEFTQWTAAGYDVYSLQYAVGVSWLMNTAQNNDTATMTLAGALGTTAIPFIPAPPFTLNVDQGTPNQEIETVIAVTSLSPVTFQVTRGANPRAHAGNVVVDSPSMNYEYIAQSAFAFLAYLGANSSTVHGDVHNITLFGHSGGAWVVQMMDMLPKGTYIASNAGKCAYCSDPKALNWDLHAVIADSIVSDAAADFKAGRCPQGPDCGVVNGIETLIGGVPDSDCPAGPFCQATAAASPDTYVGNQLQAPMMVGFSSQDEILPSVTQLGFVQRMTAAGTPVLYHEFGGNVWPGHNLDVNSQACSRYPCPPERMTGGCDSGVVGPCGALGSAASYVLSFAANLKPQSIAFEALAAQTLGSTPPPLSATASSGLDVSFRSATNEICQVNGVAITLIETGTCSIIAAQPGNASFAAATTVIQSFAVNPASTGGGGDTPLTASPATVTLQAVASGPQLSQAVTLTYLTSTPGTPTYSIAYKTSRGQGWLVVAYKSLNMTHVPAGGYPYAYSATIDIKADPAALGAAGVYTGTVKLTCGGDVVMVPVTMNVSPPPGN